LAEALDRRQALRLVSRPPLDLDALTFLADCQARNLSPNTLRIYQLTLYAFQQWLDIKDAGFVTADHLRRYMIHLQETHNAGGVHQAYRVLRTFFCWLLAEGVIDANPILKVTAPKVPQQALDPVPLSNLRAMLATCERHTLQGDRDRALLLALLDTGCRASEFVALDVQDVNLSTGAVIIRQGKGGKFRTVFLGAKTRRELLRYLRHRGEAGGPLWATVAGKPLTYAGLRQVVRRRAAVAGVPVPSLHSFRRAFAMACLRAGMDVYSLQKLMGHADLSVLRRYLQQTEGDLEVAHKRAGPVDAILYGKEVSRCDTTRYPPGGDPAGTDRTSRGEAFLSAEIISHRRRGVKSRASVHKSC
jgi:integrase/recombinase XerC/integrase/recombinase XerD